MSAALALQIALRARLVGTPAVVALVPAACIIDRGDRPAAPACIVLGEAQEIEDGGMTRRRVRVHHTLHVWRRETSLEGVTAIAGQVRAAVHAAPLDLPDQFACLGAWVSSVRTLRDPSGTMGHAVVTVEAIVEDLA
ncbi:MAG: DUF3168 domain-containing protein [Amaricoccus sp.]